MIKIFVDSGSSIKKEERNQYNVEILPLQILLDEKEYLDGENLSLETFYDALINKGIFPKTSLPNLEDTENRVLNCVKEGNEVIIITISSKISGTYNAIKSLFDENDKVRVIDSLTAVAGIKILVKEANKYLDKSLDFIEEKLVTLSKKIIALAVPETLSYLHKGGRLSSAGFAVGSLLRIKPIIQLKGGVSVAGKAIGIKSAMKFLINSLENCNTDYPIIPSYTYSTENLDELILKTPSLYQDLMLEADNIDPAVACHWGPNAFGFVFVEK